MKTEYPAWQQSYSGEQFDRVQSLASRMADDDRANGREAPAYGCSKANYEAAESIVSAARF